MTLWMRRQAPLRKSLLVLIAFLGLLAGTACSSLSVAAATVDGVKIAESEVEDEIAVLRTDPTFGDAIKRDPDTRGQRRRQILTQLIYQAVAKAEAQRRNIRPTRAQVDRLIDQEASNLGQSREEFLEEQGLSEAEAQKLGERIVQTFELRDQIGTAVTISDEQVEQTYESQKQSFEEVELERITVKTEEQARDVLEDIDGDNFSDVAQERSIDELKDEGGAMGTVAVTSLSPEAQEAVGAAVAGGVTDPVQTADGFVVYHVLDRRTKTLDEVEGQIRASLAQEQRQQGYDQWLAEQIAKAKVVVNPKYGTFDKQQLQVVPTDPGLDE
jgi:peptidyl-prolyl cis-trans isomerase SurA